MATITTDIEDPLRRGAALRPAPIPSATGLPPPSNSGMMGRRPSINMGMVDLVEPEALGRPAAAQATGVPQAAARPAALSAPTSTPGLGLPPNAARAIPQVMQPAPQGALVTTPAPTSATTPAVPAGAGSRIGQGIARGLGAVAPIAGIAGAAQSIDDISSGRRDAFQRDMGVETPLGSVAADAARTLANVGDAATFGLAGRAGRGIAASLGGGSFVDGFTGTAQPAPARAAQAPSTPGALPPAEQAQVRRVDNQPANAGAIASAGAEPPMADQFIGSPPIGSAPAGSTGLPRGVTRTGNSFEGTDVGSNLGPGLPRANPLGGMADTQAQIANIQATAPIPTGGPVIIGDPDAQRRADFFTDARQLNDLRAAQGLPSNSRARAVAEQGARAAIANTEAARMQGGLGLMREAGETQRAALTEQGVATRARAAEMRQEQANQIDRQRLGLDAQRVGIEANRDQRAAAAAETEQQKNARVDQLQNLVINGTPIQQQRAAQQLAALQGREMSGNQPPAGYRRKADGTLEFIPGGPADPSVRGSRAPLNDTQAKALQFGTRMQVSGELLDALASPSGGGVTQPGLIKRIADTFGAGAAANWTQSDPQQQVEQAQRDFINAVLRRESGAAISPQEFDNARKQYFPQPNDEPGNIELKRQNRLLATRGILAEVPDSETRVAQVRGTASPAAPPAAAGQTGAPSAAAVPPQIAELQRRAANNPALAQRLREMGY